MNDINTKYLLFEVDEEYALALSYVMEIIEYTEITRVPEAPEYIAGIINLRGHVIPVLDVRKRFRKAAGTSVIPRCIVIAQIEDSPLGLIVDNVIDLIDIDTDNLKDPPHVGANYIHVFVKYIGIADGKMHLIVDPDKLVNYDDLSFVEDVQEEDANEA